MNELKFGLRQHNLEVWRLNWTWNYLINGIRDPIDKFRSLGAKLKIVIARCKRRRFEPLFIAFYLISGTGFAGNVQLPTMPSREAMISWPTILTLLEDRSERASLSGDTNAQTEAILWLHKSQRRPRTKEEKKGEKQTKQKQGKKNWRKTGEKLREKETQNRRKKTQNHQKGRGRRRRGQRGRRKQEEGRKTKKKLRGRKKKTERTEPVDEKNKHRRTRTSRGLTDKKPGGRRHLPARANRLSPSSSSLPRSCSR